MNTANLFANQAKTLGYLFAFFTLVCGVLRGQEHEAATVERKTDVVKVFLLAGQSNMQGHGIVDLDDAKTVSYTQSPSPRDGLLSRMPSSA